MCVLDEGVECVCVVCYVELILLMCCGDVVGVEE